MPMNPNARIDPGALYSRDAMPHLVDRLGMYRIVRIFEGLVVVRINDGMTPAGTATLTFAEFRAAFTETHERISA